MDALTSPLMSRLLTSAAQEDHLLTYQGKSDSAANAGGIMYIPDSSAMGNSLGRAINSEAITAAFSNFIISSGETRYVSTWETVRKVTIRSGGMLVVASGGSAIEVFCESGGVMRTSLDGGVGINGAYIVGSHSAANLLEPADTFFMNSAAVSNFYVREGEVCTVGNGQTARDMKIRSRGRIKVSAGGTATLYMYSPSYLDVDVGPSGAYGNTYISGYGTFAIDDPGHKYVLSGGVAKRFWIFDSTHMRILSDGVASSTVIRNTDRASRRACC